MAIKQSLFAGAVLLQVFALSHSAAAESVALGNGVIVQQTADYVGSVGEDADMRFELGSVWSDELGVSVRGAFGAYLSDDVALGLIVEFGKNQREVLANAGIAFTDTTSLVGSVGYLAEKVDFGLGREKTSQMQYSVGLHNDSGFLYASAMALDAYYLDGKAHSVTSIDGNATGIQLTSTYDLTDTTQVKIASGYEWLKWRDGSKDSGFINGVALNQILTDNLSLHAVARLSNSELVYGGGLDFQFASSIGAQKLGFDYTRIDGRNGIRNDDRIQATWSINLGAPAATTSTDVAGLKDTTGTIHATSEIATNRKARKFLNALLKKPQQFSKRPLVRLAAVPVLASCGDGTVNTGEACDDGNTSNNDGCNVSCKLEFCGDGVVNGVEQCDNGNITGSSTGTECSTNCTFVILD